MKGLRWIAGGAASIAAVVILLISSFQAAMYLDFGIYEKEYTKYQVLRALDMEMEDAPPAIHRSPFMFHLISSKSTPGNCHSTK